MTQTRPASSAGPPARWGIVLGPPEDGPPVRALLDAVAPLCEARELQPEDVLRWDGTPDGARVLHRAVAARPWTGLLLLGEGLPVALHLALHTRAPVGRLRLPTLEGYHTYAQRAARASALSGPRGVLAMSVDRGPTLERLTRSWLRPVTRALGALPGVQAGPLLCGRDVTREAILRALERAPHGAIALLCAHGVGPEAPEEGPVGAPRAFDRQHLVPADLAALPAVLPDGLLWLHACHGAGTPFERPLAALLGEDPSTSGDESAPLGPALLAHPRGPVAVVAHLDTVVEVPDPEIAGADRRLAAAQLAALHRGAPLSHLAQALGDRAAGAERDLELASRVGAPGDGRIRVAVRAHNARGWIVLGDPAARLPAPIAT